LASTNYEPIIRNNLSEAFARPLSHLERSTGGTWEGASLTFDAFGRKCRVTASEVTLSGVSDTGPRGLLVSLYARHARPDAVETAPFLGFKDFQGSMPYQGAFSANSERVLIPHMARIREFAPTIKEAFGGRDGGMGDFSMILYPLPKIALSYICYLPDDEFPAAVTVLFSANALSFMPLDGLADVAEYTSREIIRLADR
jgi:hypothetical protein